jgi:hypothetical protein
MLVLIQIAQTEEVPMTVAVRLPVLWCADCRHQLVNHMFVVLGSTVLVCGFCAQDREREGARGVLAAISGEWSSLLTFPAPALTPEHAHALLTRRAVSL